MENILIIVIILALLFGLLFFVADFFEHKHLKVHISLIAGISVSYFFLLVLPEISKGLPEYPFHLEIFEYLFVLIGFSFIHVTEKLVLQKVEAKSQKRMRKLLKMESSYEVVERNIDLIIHSEIKKQKIDDITLKHLSLTLSSLNEQEEEIKSEINRYKVKIQDHINKDLIELRSITNFAYHFLIGIILVGLLIIEILSGILFFVFALFRTIITNRSERHIIFTDLEIYENAEFDIKFVNKVILSSAANMGVFIGLVFEFILPINLELELIFILFSFILGVILYSIVREIIPEKEKGNPLYFITGIAGFALIIFLFNVFTNLMG